MYFPLEEASFLRLLEKSKTYFILEWGVLEMLTPQIPCKNLSLPSRWLRQTFQSWPWGRMTSEMVCISGGVLLWFSCRNPEGPWGEGLSQLFKIILKIVTATKMSPMLKCLVTWLGNQHMFLKIFGGPSEGQSWREESIRQIGVYNWVYVGHNEDPVKMNTSTLSYWI